MWKNEPSRLIEEKAIRYQNQKPNKGWNQKYGSKNLMKCWKYSLELNWSQQEKSKIRNNATSREKVVQLKDLKKKWTLNNLNN